MPLWRAPVPALPTCFPTYRPSLTLFPLPREESFSPACSVLSGDCFASLKDSASRASSVPLRPNSSWLYPPGSSEMSHLIAVCQHVQPPGAIVYNLSSSSTPCVTLSTSLTSQASVSPSVKWVMPPSQDRCEDQRAECLGKARCKPSKAGHLSRGVFIQTASWPILGMSEQVCTPHRPRLHLPGAQVWGSFCLEFACVSFQRQGNPWAR